MVEKQEPSDKPRTTMADLPSSPNWDVTKLGRQEPPVYAPEIIQRVVDKKATKPESVQRIFPELNLTTEQATDILNRALNQSGFRQPVAKPYQKMLDEQGSDMRPYDISAATTPIDELMMQSTPAKPVKAPKAEKPAPTTQTVTARPPSAEATPVPALVPETKVPVETKATPQEEDLTDLNSQLEDERDANDKKIRGVEDEDTIGAESTYPYDDKSPNFLLNAVEMIKNNEIGLPPNKSGAYNGTQLLGTLMNKLTPTEQAIYKSAGIEKAFGGKIISKDDVVKWLEENGPKVEVRKFSKDYTADQSQLYADSAAVEHELDTKYPQWRDENITADYTNDPKFRELLQKHANAQVAIDRMEARDGNANPHWQSIAPKSEKDMPGYVEIAVVKPGKKVSDELGRQKEIGHQFPSSHNFPPNTLGFVRGYMETLPNGKKVFHVIEVQSDWAAQRRIAEKAIEGYDKNARAIKLSPDSRGEENGWIVHYKNSDGQAVSASSRDATSAEDAIARVRKSQIEHPVRNQTANDPLLPHYERLALKAAIEHARKEGADSIAVSDAETAMMTEGHDRGGAREYEVKVDGASDVKLSRAFGENYKREGGFNTAIIRTQRPNAKAEIEATGGKVIKENGLITQEPGMRLHYDKTLQRIAEELTGQKGERVSFGEHKNVRNPNPSREALYGEKGNLRKDLIFRNPDGTPKTDVSGKMYPLEKVPQRAPKMHGKAYTEGASTGEQIHSPVNVIQHIMSGNATTGSVLQHFADLPNHPLSGIAKVLVDSSDNSSLSTKWKQDTEEPGLASYNWKGREEQVSIGTLHLRDARVLMEDLHSKTSIITTSTSYSLFNFS